MTTGDTYASVSRVDVSRLTDSEKLDFIVTKLNVVDLLQRDVHSLKTDLQYTRTEVEHLQVANADLTDRVSRNEYKLLDLEARSRRNNLVFHQIAEVGNETWEKTEEILITFIKDKMKMGEDAGNIVFQRVHRLGRPRQGGRPRPIIAGFRDFKVKENVFGYSKFLRDTDFSVSNDYPAEIRSARGRLWKDYRAARAQNIPQTVIAYPAKLIIHGELVRDEFPGWSQMLNSNQYDSRNNAPAPRSFQS